MLIMWLNSNLIASPIWGSCKRQNKEASTFDRYSEIFLLEIVDKSYVKLCDTLIILHVEICIKGKYIIYII